MGGLGPSRACENHLHVHPIQRRYQYVLPVEHPLDQGERAFPKRALWSAGVWFRPRTPLRTTGSGTSTSDFSSARN